jgi:hypothetical protein
MKKHSFSDEGAYTFRADGNYSSNVFITLMRPQPNQSPSTNNNLLNPAQ